MNRLSTGANDCCGTSVCDLCFDDFIAAGKALYPDFGGHLCPDSNFERLVTALVRPLYAMIVDECGLCDLAREADPLTACCMIECWYDEYGVPAECGETDTCPDQDAAATISRRAELHARVLMEWGALPNAEFWSELAAFFGLTIELDAPTLIDSTNPPVACEIVPQVRQARDGRRVDHIETIIPHPRGCQEVPSAFLIRVTCAPQSVIYDGCDVRPGQPVRRNYWFEAFACLVQKLAPMHTQVCFEEAYLTHGPCEEHDDPCPVPAIDPCTTQRTSFLRPVYNCQHARAQAARAQHRTCQPPAVNDCGELLC